VQFNIIMSESKISMAQLIKDVNETFGSTNDIYQAIFQTSITLAETINLSLRSKESLILADDNNPSSVTPIGIDKDAHIICPEILSWSMAVLASAWTEWVFTSKTSNPNYQNDPIYSNDPARQAAIVNVRLLLPYIRNSILDAIDKAHEIGLSKETNYEPDPVKDPAKFELRENQR
jgi:hypothetical protein